MMVFSHLMRKWSVGILLTLPVPFFMDLTAKLGCIWILAVVSLTILDIREMREKSVFVKYNPMVEACKLPKGCILTFCIFAVIVVLIKFLMMSFGK